VKKDLVVGSLRNKKIISLDIGRRTGWAVFAPNFERNRDSGVFELYADDVNKKQPDYTDADRFAAFARFVNALDDAVGGADVVVFEQVDGGTKGRQTVLYNGYRAVLMSWAKIAGKTIYPVPVHANKRIIAGRGGASKDEVINAIVNLGYLPFDDNEADAIGCLHTVVRLSQNPGALEREIIAAERLHLGEFKTGSVVVEKKERRKVKGAPRTVDLSQNVKKDSRSPLTMVRASSITNASPTMGDTCSSDSQESARQVKRTPRKSSLKKTTSSQQSSPPPSKRARAKPSRSTSDTLTAL